MNWFNRKADKRIRQRLQAELPVFYPSSGNYWLYPHLTYSAANNLPKQLLRLVAGPAAQSVNSSDLAGDGDDRLDDLFGAYGSDKGVHGYAPVYNFVFRSLGRPDFTLLEIGLGTNDPVAISTMGTAGRPGASLRAFRDYMPKAAIYGVDIDRNILFSEQGIRTGWLDQTDPATFDGLVSQLGCASFDVIIDDGLHSSEANLNTIDFWRRSSSQGGWVVIEDIPERTFDVWRVVAALLEQSGHDCWLIKASDCFMFAARHAGQDRSTPSALPQSQAV